MRGEKVTVWTRRKAGTDEMGEEVWAWEPTVVADVLVRPHTGGDLTDATRPSGVRVNYTLAFPSTFSMSADELASAKVALTERGMVEADAMEVIGWPDIIKPCPTRWNRLVDVGRVDG